MKKLTVTFALALLGAAVLNTAANAQSASAGDLILGFQVPSTSTTNASYDFESDLGQYTNFTLLPAKTVVNLTAGLTTAGQTGAFKLSDLTTLFGSDKITGEILGVVPSDPTRDIFVSQGTKAGAPSLDSQNDEYYTIESMTNSFSQGTELGSATDISVPNSDAGTYSKVAGSNGSVGGYFNGNYGQTTYSSTGTAVFDLYSSPTGSGTATEIGYFTLYGASDTTDAGQLTYTAIVGAPEPSTYAMMFLGLGALAFIMRRRMAQVG